MVQEIKESYSPRSLEIIGEMNDVIGMLQSKLNICLSPNDTGLVKKAPEECEECEECDLAHDLRLVLQSLESLYRRVVI